MKILSQENYKLAMGPLKDVTINNLFARSVVEKCISGTVFVDNLETPRVFCVVHPYGMALLYGDINDHYIHNELEDFLLRKNELRKKAKWLQVYPTECETKIDAMLGDKIIAAEDDNQQNTILKTKNIQVIKHTRVNFTFNQEKFEIFKRENITEEYEIVKTDNRLFSEMNGSVVPKKFWDTEDDFAERAIGFSLLRNGELVTTAFSSFIHDNLLELGMETKPEYRKKGFAKYACATLIAYCIENGYEPVWACRLGNRGSYNLALKLGFEPVKYLPYYELIV